MLQQDVAVPTGGHLTGRNLRPQLGLGSLASGGRRFPSAIHPRTAKISVPRVESETGHPQARNPTTPGTRVIIEDWRRDRA